MLCFRLSTALLCAALAAVGVGWWVDHRSMEGRIRSSNPAVSIYGEKHTLWSPHAYLNKDVNEYEKSLASRVDFEGRMVTSSQGLGKPFLRLPTRPTIKATVQLLDDTDPSVRQDAAELLALYLQAASGSNCLDAESLEARAYFNAIALPKIHALLSDKSPRMRSAAALILGNTLYDRETERRLIKTFDVETSGDVKWKLGWAYWALGNNYDRAHWYLKNQDADSLAAEPVRI